jgi:hypothetical protein
VRRLKKKVIASALALATLFEPMLPQTSQALADIQSVNDNTLQVYLDGIQSAKARGVFQDRGVLFAVYDPYGKRLKMFHYWVAVGSSKDDKLTNTQCGVGAVASVNIIGALRLKDPKRIVNSSDLLSLGYRCSSKTVGDKTLNYCTSDKGSFYYDTDGSVVNVTPLNGVLCRRQVNGEALKQANIIADTDGNVINNVGQEDAAKIVAKYAYFHKIQYALFVVETFDVKTTVSGSLPKKITYQYYEVPKYYGIVAGVGGGTPLGNGYYMVDGQGIGNSFDRNGVLLFSKSQTDQIALDNVLINTLLPSGPINISLNTLQNILNGTTFFNQPLSLATNIINGIKRGFNIEDGEIKGKKIPKFVEKEYLSNDKKVITGTGASQITEKLISGSEYNQTLKGFKEPAVEKSAYQGWKKVPGGFIKLPSQ